MSYARFLFHFVLVVSFLVCFSGCNETGQTDTKAGESADRGSFEFLPLYGDGPNDLSSPVAQVGEIVLTEKMLDLRYGELTAKMKLRYQGDDGRRLLLNQMVDESIMVLGAVEEELYNLPEVTALLNAHRRITLDSAMRNLGLIKDNEPSDDQLRDYYLENKENYRSVDLAKGRHVECANREDADSAFKRLSKGGAKNNWPHVVNDYTQNEETQKLAGEFGWFNLGSFMPMMESPLEFTTAAIELEPGLHQPILIDGTWHVIEILKKEYSRTMTFAKASPQIKKDMLAGFQDALIKDYLRGQRKTLGVSLLGKYAPGMGLSADEIFERGMLLSDDLEKIEMLSMIFEDFPEDERADDALYWVALASMDAWVERSIARRYLNILLEDYPDSELVDDAQFLLDNMSNSKVTSPSSMEELRRNSK